MIIARTRILTAVLVASLSATVAIGQLATSVGRGTVTDGDGNPVQGVTVTFQNTGNETARVTTTTNKKGRFFVDNLMYYATGRWLVVAELEGYVATAMNVESRTQQAVIGKVNFKLSPDKKPSEIDIRPYGTATFEITMIPEATWAENNAQQPAGDATVTEGSAAKTRIAPQEDPFQAAFRLAGAGELEESLPFFENAAKAAPDDSELLEGWANVLYRLQRMDEAIVQAQAAIDADPARRGPHKILYSGHMSNENWEGASAALDAMETSFPGDAWVLEQRAVIASGAGDVPQMIAAYEALVADQPTHKEGWVALGSLYADAGLTDKSRAAFQKVVEIDPTDAYRTFFNIGALVRSKPDVGPTENDRAIAAFRKSIEIKPDYAPAHRELANALLAKGDLPGAKASLQRYLEVSPKADDAAQVKAMITSLGG